MSWINVDDSLPEINKKILVWAAPVTPTMEGCVMSITSRIDLTTASSQIKRMVDENGFRNVSKVYFWQELPPAPKK